MTTGGMAKSAAAYAGSEKRDHVEHGSRQFAQSPHRETGPDKPPLEGEPDRLLTPKRIGTGLFSPDPEAALSKHPGCLAPYSRENQASPTERNTLIYRLLRTHGQGAQVLLKGYDSLTWEDFRWGESLEKKGKKGRGSRNESRQSRLEGSGNWCGFRENGPGVMLYAPRGHVLH